MTNPFEDKNLTREKLRHLIELAENHVTRDEVEQDSTEFDWQIPHHFSPSQLESIEIFTQKLASHINKAIFSLCHGEFDVMVTETEQQFAYVLADLVSKEQPKHYFLPFNGTDNQACGYLSVSPEASLMLIGHMLRDTNAGDDPEKELSQLEETILMDIVTAIMDAFTDTIKDECGTALRRPSKFVKGLWPLHTENLEDMCNISMTVSHPEGSMEITFAMLSDILEAVVGGKPLNTLKPSPQKISNMLMQTMHEAPVRVAAQLCSASISLNDIMNLQKDDILLLDKKIDDPVDVLLNEHISFKAYQAKSHGKHAVVITKQEEE